MPYTAQQITTLENPYKELGTADALAEHRVELNKLSPKEMKELAQRIILACPANKMNDFGHAINALKAPEGAFHPFLSQAYEVKKRILTLLEPAHKTPYLLLVGLEDVFNNFKELALELVKTNTLAIAIRLALTTPENKHQALIRTLRITFPQSALITKISETLLVQRGVAQLLKDPLKFFTNQEFFSKQGANVNLFCKDYVELFTTQLKGQEQAIGYALANLTPAQRQDICHKLKEIETLLGHDTPFKSIAAVMASHEPQNLRIIIPSSPKKISSPGSNPHSFHAKSAAAPNSPANAKELGLTDGELSPADSDDEQGWFAACLRFVNS